MLHHRAADGDGTSYEVRPRNGSSTERVDAGPVRWAEDQRPFRSRSPQRAERHRPAATEMSRCNCRPARRKWTMTPLDPHLRSGSMLRGVDDVMPIGEFSERSGLSPKRLRSYAAGGLLVPTAVDSASGYRFYSVGQLRTARLIDTLREAGVPLADIAAFLRGPSCDQLDGWARRVEID